MSMQQKENPTKSCLYYINLLHLAYLMIGFQTYLTNPKLLDATTISYFSFLKLSFIMLISPIISLMRVLTTHLLNVTSIEGHNNDQPVQKYQPLEPSKLIIQQSIAWKIIRSWYTKGEPYYYTKPKVQWKYDPKTTDDKGMPRRKLY